MQKFRFIILMFFLFNFNIQAQTGLVIKGSEESVSTLFVENGVHLYVLGTLLIDSSIGLTNSGSDFLQNNGTIHLLGSQSNFTNNVANLKTYTQGQTSGEFIFESDDLTQAINGSSAVEFMNMRVSNSYVPQLELNQNVRVAGSLNLQGVINIKDNNLTLLPSATLIGAPYSPSNMIQADASGAFIRSVAAGSGTYLYPIGDANAVYSPVSLAFTSNATSGTVGANLKPTIHPEMNNPEAVSDYLSRYWALSNSGLSTYSYTANFSYVSSDVFGSEQNIKLSRWVNPWINIEGSTAILGILNITEVLNENTFPLTGDFTGRRRCTVPQAGFSYEQSSGFSVNFTSTVNIGSAYLWDFGNGNSSNEQNPEFTFPIVGNYPVTLVISNACGSDTITTIIIVNEFVSVEEINRDDILIYPNPTSDFLFIQFTENFTENPELTIYNATGQIVHIEKLKRITNTTIKVDMTHLINGYYVLNLKGKKQHLSRKIMMLK